MDSEKFPEVLPEIIPIEEELSSFPLSVGHGHNNKHNIGNFHGQHLSYQKYHGHKFDFYVPLKYPAYKDAHGKSVYLTEAFKLTAVPYQKGYYYIYYDSTDKDAYSHYHQTHGHGIGNHFFMQFLINLP